MWVNRHGRVVVGLISDEGMRVYKRDPIMPYDQRARVLECFAQVDEVIPLDGVVRATHTRCALGALCCCWKCCFN